ncbi:MAG TPA: YkvA family protein [Rhizomicrobium sp.]
MGLRSDSAAATLARLVADRARTSRLVERDFWRKLLRYASRLPFAEDLAAAYFCAVDPLTPARVKGVLLGALAYFVLPFDAVPDFIAGFGFTDDAAVLAMAIRLVSRHVKDSHYTRARAALGLPQQAIGES